MSVAATSRYSRHILLPEIGVQGQRRLSSSRVLVIGAGGLGSPVIMYLAAAGIGTLRIVDFDVVDESNPQRQVIHGQSDTDRPKVDGAWRRVREVNPLVSVETHRTAIDPSKAVDLVSGYHIVVDGSDNFDTRYVVDDACVVAERPSVWGSVFRFEGQVSVFAGGLRYRDLYPEAP
ncbi:MAG: adenylyltransferase/sulfurtransferase MoeZ, partial [Micrococcales bacterium]